MLAKKMYAAIHSQYNQREAKKLAPKQEYKRTKLEETVETRGTW